MLCRFAISSANLICLSVACLLNRFRSILFCLDGFTIFDINLKNSSSSFVTHKRTWTRPFSTCRLRYFFIRSVMIYSIQNAPQAIRAAWKCNTLFDSALVRTCHIWRRDIGFGYRLMLCLFYPRCFVFLPFLEETRFITRLFFDVNTLQLFFYYVYQVMHQDV